jgi:tRNA dimethylallyltransferase
MLPREPLLVLTGPSASGKESVALELAELIGGEIVSLDSMKIYRELDVATAKPTAEMRRRVPHHLIDIATPDLDFSTGDYLPRLIQSIETIRSRSLWPVISGGTALYLVAWLRGFSELPRAAWDVRQRLIAEAEAGGLPALHARLSAVDPAAAARYAPADLRRVVRALEVFETTGRPISEQWTWGASAFPENILLFGLGRERAELYARTDARVLRMFDEGLIEEARRLRDRVPPLGRSASQCIGYKEIFEGEAAGRATSAIIEEIQRNTRRFVKRQETWFRKLPIRWIPISGAQDSRAIARRICEEARWPPPG